MTDHIKIDTKNILHTAIDLRKATEKAVREQINAIWHGMESWPLDKLDALMADLKKHLP